MRLGDARLAVSFSLDKEMDIYEVAEAMAKEKRFSAWVKRYLQAELQRRKVPQASTIQARLGE